MSDPIDGGSHQAIDEDWLRSVGFREGPTGCMMRGPLHADVHACRTFGVRLEWYVGKTPQACIPAPATREDVATLARLLGYVLQDGGAS